MKNVSLDARPDCVFFICKFSLKLRTSTDGAIEGKCLTHIWRDVSDSCLFNVESFFHIIFCLMVTDKTKVDSSPWTWQDWTPRAFRR